MRPPTVKAFAELAMLCETLLNVQTHNKENGANGRVWQSGNQEGKIVGSTGGRGAESGGYYLTGKACFFSPGI